MSQNWPEERVARLAELWASDLPAPMVAAEMRLSVDGLYYAARRYDLPKRNARRASGDIGAALAMDMRTPDMRPTYAAQTAELVERYVALSHRVQAERRAA